MTDPASLPLARGPSVTPLLPGSPLPVPSFLSITRPNVPADPSVGICFVTTRVGSGWGMHREHVPLFTRSVGFRTIKKEKKKQNDLRKSIRNTAHITVSISANANMDVFPLRGFWRLCTCSVSCYVSVLSSTFTSSWT